MMFDIFISLLLGLFVLWIKADPIVEVNDVNNKDDDDFVAEDFFFLKKGKSTKDYDVDCHWPSICPGTIPSYPQTWATNRSTIIMPCNYTGFTDPKMTKDWGIVDFDWSNAKGRGTADGWAKHQPMDNEEMLFQQVEMSTTNNNNTTYTKAWIYRNTVYGYPWYTTVRKLLEKDPNSHPWFMSFKKEGPWFSDKCDSYKKDVCSDLYHSQEQSPGYPHGDGDCSEGGGCDCGKGIPCGFYIFNHSSTVLIDGRSFQDWFVYDYMLNFVTMPQLNDKITGMFWDDVWNPECKIHDQVPHTCQDMGLSPKSPELIQLTNDYRRNMDALADATLRYGKFSWQMLWTGNGGPNDIGSTGPTPIVTKDNCIVKLRELCDRYDSPSQTRAMMYQLTLASRHDVRNMTDLNSDITNFLLIHGKYAWLGHSWEGCSRNYIYPDEFRIDYGEPYNSNGAYTICHEVENGIFTREFTRCSVMMNCNKWQGSIRMKEKEEEEIEELKRTT